MLQKCRIKYNKIHNFTWNFLKQSDKKQYYWASLCDGLGLRNHLINIPLSKVIQVFFVPSI